MPKLARFLTKLAQFLTRLAQFLPKTARFLTTLTTLTTLGEGNILLRKNKKSFLIPWR
jgi:hypothetical protein